MTARNKMILGDCQLDRLAVHTRDGIGRVHDFLFRDTSWLIRYIEVGTRNWLPGGKRVILSPQRATQVVGTRSR